MDIQDVHAPLNCTEGNCEEGPDRRARAAFIVHPVEPLPAAVNAPAYACGVCTCKLASAYVGFGWGLVAIPITRARPKRRSRAYPR